MPVIKKAAPIPAESAPIEEEMAETGRRLRELFRKQQVPGIFRSKLYYALYWPQHFGEWMQILLFVALLFVALPCGIYFLALPDSLRHIPALVLIYIADIVLIGGTDITQDVIQQLAKGNLGTAMLTAALQAGYSVETAVV